MKIIIIGAGPGGYETAVEAAARGIETTIISDGPLGGTCLNEGCIPTKTFCNMAAPDQEKKNAVITQLQNGIASLMKNKLITLVYGKARLSGSRSVVVDDTEYSADAIIIATGSVSASLPIPGAELAISSKEMLEMSEVPSRLCIIGGGVIGLEFASIFRKFGSEVSVLEYCPSILPRFDVDLAKRLKASLSKRGISIETAAQVCSIETDGDIRRVKYIKKDQEYSVDADCVLMAVGRRPNIDSLNFDDAGIAYTKRGVTVDENMQTSVPGIYAIGDITGGLMLAHVATYQGLRALNHICGETDEIDFSIVPAAVFTVPEAAVVGLTEENCEGRSIKCHKAFYRANGKAVSMDATDGYCKVISDAESGRILGVHILGEHASDLIHEAGVLIGMGATISQARSMIHAHPSLSEVLQSALHA